VAARAFVSVKTVEANLTRVYRKLGVRSRVGLANALHEAHGESPPAWGFPAFGGPLPPPTVGGMAGESATEFVAECLWPDVHEADLRRSTRARARNPRGRPSATWARC
jgi:hypothetical protein